MEPQLNSNKLKHQPTSNRKILMMTGLLLQLYFLLIALPSVTSLFSEVLRSLEAFDFFDMNDQIALIQLQLFIENMTDGVEVIVIIMSTIVLINAVLFVLLVLGKWTPKQAKTIYLYQGIIGIILLMIQPLAGILYIYSGFGGFQSVELSETNIRQGI
ncbi:MAG: hypothetical protein ACO3MF_01430 [Acholeplasmataceae bacterium]